MIKDNTERLKVSQYHFQGKASLKSQKRDKQPIKLKKLNQLLVNLHRICNNLKDKDKGKEYYSEMNRSI